MAPDCVLPNTCNRGGFEVTDVIYTGISEVSSLDVVHGRWTICRSSSRHSRSGDRAWAVDRTVMRETQKAPFVCVSINVV